MQERGFAKCLFRRVKDLRVRVMHVTQLQEKLSHPEEIFSGRLQRQRPLPPAEARGAQRIGARPAPKAVKMRVSTLLKPRATSGKSPTGSWQSRKRGWSGGSGCGQSGDGRYS